ncbi:MAG TPA: hypothetical protein VLH08_04865 [Acidobacteriota bacterium]|nr:hypothetical protein [Acidobacteriota bacterium]
MLKFLQKIRFWLLHRLPDCDSATKMMSDRIDNHLPLKQRFQLYVHNLLCGWCRDYLKQIKLLRRAAMQDNEENLFPDASLSDEAKERIKRSLSSQ